MDHSGQKSDEVDLCVDLPDATCNIKSNSSKVAIERDSREAAVVVKFSPPLLEQVSQENWEAHFGDFRSVIKQYHYFQSKETQELHILVVFDSVLSAEEASLALNDTFLCGLYRLSISFELEPTFELVSSICSPELEASNYNESGATFVFTPGPEIVSTVDCSFFLTKLREEKLACRKKNEEEISNLKLTKIQSKNIPLEKFNKVLAQINAEKELHSHFIIESNLRRDVFLWQLDQIEAEIYQLEESLNASEEVKVLFTRFVRESRRYRKALPIFAHRRDIMDVIDNNQVCVLVGETGSGKSTQLVQYLYEAGYASNGLIVCTQPRKLAAISLAEHVSKEVDENIGDTYGYLITKGKRSTNTKVLFMTDHTLLNECIADPNLSKYSCLVIDEAHERSIHTDILIAFIKRCLPNRPDLKVVITSATIDPTIFSAYFDKCPVIKVPGRTYPVEVKWGSPDKNLVEQDYVTDAVTKVYDIHVSKRNEPGDVLVFLTCPAEIEKACKLALDVLKNEAIILPLHGKLQPEDQQKIFDDTPGKRKVVFSTNVAETSVTIPGIVYVIDTGLSKELCYDPQKNMNSLEIRPISKSSADQRKGRAGRTCPGECYRLYSESDYADMRDNSVPEIMRITLAFAVIKLYEFGIEDIHSFEFVESPDRKALDEAVENLKFLGAIKDEKLTRLGRKMALLPLDPNLSRVLFDAINEGIGAEAAAAVAISTLSGRVFFRPESTESQDQSENMKLPFCQASGDQMTYLHTFYEWSLQERASQTKWCVANFVNAKSMRMVQEIVKDLRFILKDKCRITISQLDEIASLEAADKFLPKLFFYAFLRNICVHLGHDRVGYWSERLPEEQLVIYRGSSLCSLGSVPKCVIYERTQKTSQHFLLQVLPVREEWIQEAMQLGKLPCHPAESSLFKYFRVSTSEALTFTNLGPRLSQKLFHAYPHDRRRIIPEFSNFEVRPVFEHLRDQGLLRVFAQVHYHDEICAKINDLIERFRKELSDDFFKCGLTSNNDDVKMVIGQGGCIRSILMPEDFQTVVVRGLDRRQIPSAQHELSSLGSCTSRIDNDYRGIQLFVNFENPSDAARALTYRFTSISCPNVKILNHRDKRDSQFHLKVEWWRRQRRDIAYVNFDKDNTFSQVYLQFCGGFFDSETGLKFSIHRTSLKVSGVSHRTTEDQIRSMLLSYVPNLSEEDFSVCFLYSTPAHEETNQSFSMQRDNLDAFLAQGAPPNSYYVFFRRPPSPKTVLYRAFVHFSDSVTCWKMFQHFQERAAEEFVEEDDSDDDDEDDEDACSDGSRFDQGVVYRYPYQVELSLTSSTRYTGQIFSVIKLSVEKMSRRYSSKSTKIESKPDRWGNTFVSIATNNNRAYKKVKKALGKAVEPEVIPFTESKENQYVSTLNFQKNVREIQTKTSTYIKINSSSLTTSTVAIYGTRENREMARDEVNMHVQTVLHGETKCFEFDMKKEKPGLMKHLVERYGSDTSGITFEGITATKLIPRSQVLTLFATEAGYQAFLRSLDSFKPAEDITQAQAQDTEVSSSNECCVCAESHNMKQRKTFFYRLEYCGHVYCRDCIELQLQPSSITFPITCAAENCEKPLVWKDFDNLFKDEVKSLREITSASLKSYVEKNTDKVHNCTTPDCMMVYVISETGKRFICRQCGANICTKCHTTWHEGFNTCNAYKNHKELGEWLKADPANRKLCPNCNAPIEKIEGCQHMTCTQCKKHICWHCLEFFEKSDECYGHLRAKHGGYM